MQEASSGKLDQPQAPIKRNLSSVSIGGIVKEGSERTKRVKVLDPEQKQAIENMTSAADLPREERQRQWAALDRRLKAPDLPPGLIEKWNHTDRKSKFPS